jgi:nucleoside-triphosphatase
MSITPGALNNLLLTGVSGVGKSTLIRKIATTLSGRPMQGFVSAVIQEGNQRKGWRLDTFDGHGGILAHVDLPSDYHMGQYGVDMALFERLVASQLVQDDKVELYLLDEIGIIAPWSQCFITTMNALLDADQKVIAVIRRRGTGYIQQVKDRPDVELWEVTRDNRDRLLTDVLGWIDRSR